MLRRVVVVRIDISEQHFATIIRMQGINELVQFIINIIVLPIALFLSTLMKEALRSSETSGLIRAT
jgi:hypothetical protein